MVRSSIRILKFDMEKPFERIPTPFRTARVNGMHINVDRLIELAVGLSVESVSMDKFEAIRQHDRGWRLDDGTAIGPAQLIALGVACHGDFDLMKQEKPEWSGDIERVKIANTDIPILVLAGSFHIIDGMHRLTKLFIQGGSEVGVKFISPDLLASCHI